MRWPSGIHRWRPAMKPCPGGGVGIRKTGAPSASRTTLIAVDPAWQRHAIGTRLLIALTREARAREARNLTLEVRLSNLGAQHLYRRFGFSPVGVRKNYYPETNEDALVMWVHEVDTPEYDALLHSIEATIPGETTYEDPKRW